MEAAVTKEPIKKYQFTKQELTNVKPDAYISDCGIYRYWRTREWNKDLPRVMFVLLNPSTADHELNDQTVKRCIGFAKGWGYGSIEIFNLFSYITKDPEVLKKVIDEKGEEVAIGPENDDWIKVAVERADLIVLGWGNNATDFKGRREKVLQLLKGKKVKCLGITSKKQPCHPRTLAYCTNRVDYLAK